MVTKMKKTDVNQYILSITMSEVHSTIFVYQHSIRDEGSKCIVRLFGLNKDGSTAVVKVSDYRPYFYIEVPPMVTLMTRRKDDMIKYIRSGDYKFPTDIKPVLESSRISLVGEEMKSIKLQDRHALPNGSSYKGMMIQLICCNGSTGRTGEYKKVSHYDPVTNTIHVGYPFSKKKYTTMDYYKIHPPFGKKIEYQQSEPKCTFLQRKHLYFAHKRREENGYVDSKTEFLKVEFQTLENMKACFEMMNREHLVTLEGLQKRVYLKSHEYESGITPLLKFFAVSQLPSVGWVDVLVPKLEEQEDTFAEYGIDEYKCSYKAIQKSNFDGFVSPKVLTFDIEAYSHIYNAPPPNPVYN